MISAGAKVLGSFKIGDNSKIGAGSVVLEEVPSGSTVVGVPGRVVKRRKQCFPQEEMDQTNLPDPVKEDIFHLQQTNSELTNRLLELEGTVKELQKRLDGKEGRTADGESGIKNGMECGMKRKREVTERNCDENL